MHQNLEERGLDYFVNISNFNISHIHFFRKMTSPSLHFIDGKGVKMFLDFLNKKRFLVVICICFSLFDNKHCLV